MNINGFKGYERCDQWALDRWEDEGGCIGVIPQNWRIALENGRRGRNDNPAMPIRLRPTYPESLKGMSYASSAAHFSAPRRLARRR
jgi:hypothetical protein